MKSMKKTPIIRYIWLFLFSCYAFIGISQNLNESGWKLVNEEDGIIVYTRTTENSPVKEIRIICTVKTTMERMVDFLSDVPLYADWVYKCDTAYQFSEVTSSEFSYYITLDFPFPFDNRDLAVHSHHRIDPTTGAYHSHSATDTLVAYSNDEYIHITEFESTWNIVPTTDGILLVDYQALSNPGGDIPAWLVNLVITKGPLETMRRFASMAETY